MGKVLGFFAQKIGLSCSSCNSRSFIDGWFLGAGITVKVWTWQSRSFGRVFSFGHGAIVISYY